jgi:hypothetical protein
MKTSRTLLLLVAAAIILAVTSPALAMEEEKLIAPDGTVYVVRAGTAAELGITDGSVAPDESVIAWSSLRQDGTRGFGLVPGAAGRSFKHDIDLAFDEPTGSLVVLWTDEVPLVNLLRLGILRAGQWTVSDLLPTNGFPHVLNPRMLLSHSVVHTTDPDGKDVSRTRSMLSILWWEESNVSQARYAPMFLDEDSTASQVQVYNLPATIGSAGKTASGDHPQGAFIYPSLQLDGIEGALLASFADLGADKQYVVRITFPSDLGKPGPDNATWQRRRIPVVGVASEGPISDTVPPIGIDRVTTVIGTSYRPTIIWRADSAVGFSRFDGKTWSSARTIPLDSAMSYDRALRLVQEMATRN